MNTSHLILWTNFRIRFLFHFVESLAHREETVLVCSSFICVRQRVCVPRRVWDLCQSHKAIYERRKRNTGMKTFIFCCFCCTLYSVQWIFWLRRKWKVANTRAKQNVELDNCYLKESRHNDTLSPVLELSRTHVGQTWMRKWPKFMLTFHDIYDDCCCEVLFLGFGFCMFHKWFRLIFCVSESHTFLFSTHKLINS